MDSGSFPSSIGSLCQLLCSAVVLRAPNQHCVTLSKNKVITPRFIRIYIITYENKRGRGHGTVKGKPEERAAQLALYMIENKQTVRGAAKAFGISKSTVHIVVN